MAQYKTIAGPIGFTITHKETYDTAVRQYAGIIDREAVGGWELFCIQQIPVTQTPGCLASLFGSKPTTVYFNMLVFVHH